LIIAINKANIRNIYSMRGLHQKTICCFNRIKLVVLSLGIVLSQAGVYGAINPDYLNLLDQCEEQNLSAADCKLMLAESGVKVLIVKPRSIDDIFYNQVVITVDYVGNVLGGSPGDAFDGMIQYPFEWRSKPIWGYGNRTVGPWDCKDMTAADCCYKIEASVVDRDIHNKLIDCWLQEAKIKDENEVAQQVYKAANGTIQIMTNDELKEFESRENIVRIKLMQDILKALENEQISKKEAWMFVGRIRQGLRGIERAQAFPYRIKNQIRQVWDKEFVPMNGVMTYMFRATFKILTELWEAGGREHLRARDGNLIVLETDNADWDMTDVLRFTGGLE